MLILKVSSQISGKVLVRYYKGLSYIPFCFWSILTCHKHSNQLFFIYADDSSISYQHKEVDEIEKQLNKDLENTCDWFVDNKLNIHFGKDKTKSILFASKQRSMNVHQMNFKYKQINIKQDSQVIYLWCMIDVGWQNKTKFINKINGKLTFLYKKKRHLNKELRRILCNALIQLHFNYACQAWYPNLNEKTKKKLQILQNKCIYFCLKLDKMHHISKNEFRLINWLLTSKRVDQCINIIN